MITWQVVHAPLPPHACSRGMSKFFATSRNDSGLPWFEYGSLPASNSTVCASPSMMNVTLGIFVDVLPGERRLDGAIHHDLGQMSRRIVERVRLRLNDLTI